MPRSTRPSLRLIAACIAVGIALIATGLLSWVGFVFIGALLIAFGPLAVALPSIIASKLWRSPEQRYDAIGDDIRRMLTAFRSNSRRARRK